MTRRDYQIITETLALARSISLKSDNLDTYTVDGVANMFGLILSKQNKAFDRELFIKNVRGEQ